MRFLIDECLHESLVELAHAAGSDATHVNYLGLSGQPDWMLAERIAKDEFTFVTNNRSDFVELFARMALHPGLIVIVPNVTPVLQRALFGAALKHVDRRDVVNTVVEDALDGEVVRIVEYEPRRLTASSDLYNVCTMKPPLWPFWPFLAVLEINNLFVFNAAVWFNSRRLHQF